MIATSCNFHIDETVNFYISELGTGNDSYVLRIAESRGSYPDVTIFLSHADLGRLRAVVNEYLSTLPAEGEVQSDRKEAVQAIS